MPHGKADSVSFEKTRRASAGLAFFVDDAPGQAVVEPRPHQRRQVLVAVGRAVAGSVGAQTTPAGQSLRGGALIRVRPASAAAATSRSTPLAASFATMSCAEPPRRRSD